MDEGLEYDALGTPVANSSRILDIKENAGRMGYSSSVMMTPERETKSLRKGRSHQRLIRPQATVVIERGMSHLPASASGPPLLYTCAVYDFSWTLCRTLACVLSVTVFEKNVMNS